MTSEGVGTPDSLRRRVSSKWSQDASAPLSRRVKRATTYGLDVGRARLYLRGADDVAPDVRVIGRPIVRNDGHLSFGPGVFLRSIVAPIEIYVGPGASMVVGKNTHINSGGTFAALARVELGQRVEIAPHVTIYDTSFHTLYDRNKVPEPRPVIIEDDVWLGTKCTVLPGVRIGRGSVVMANSLVTRNVEPFTIMSGVPAEPVAQLDPARFVVDPTA